MCIRDSNNTTSIDCSVSVVDGLDPVAVCPTTATIVSLDADGMGSLAADALVGMSTDNCSVASETSPATTYSCEDLGTQTVTLTVVDGSTNTTSIDCSVSVVDGIAPVAVCPTTATIVSLDADGIGSLAADALVGSSTDNCSVASETSPAATYSCEDIGTQTVTLTVVDGSNNTCLLYTSPSPRDATLSRMPSSA